MIAAFRIDALMQKEETMNKFLAVVLMILGVILESVGFQLFND